MLLFFNTTVERSINNMVIFTSINTVTVLVLLIPLHIKKSWLNPMKHCFSHGFPMVFPWKPPFSYGCPIKIPPCSYGFPMVFPWIYPPISPGLHRCTRRNVPRTAARHGTTARPWHREDSVPCTGGIEWWFYGDLNGDFNGDLMGFNGILWLFNVI